MAAAPGSTIKDAYGSKAPRNPRETPAEFVPKASAGLKAELASNAAAVARDVKAATSGDPFAKRPGGELPGFPKGGRKSRRRRRGGAMIKPLPELIADLEREPTKATLENVISDLKASDDRRLMGMGEGTGIRLGMRLRPGETMEQRVRATIDGLLPLLRSIRGGRRRKTTRRR